jgi:hypothetical protein
VSYYRTIVVPDPVVGADWALVAPGQGWWRVVSLVARFVASAAVANRQVELRADDQTSIWFASKTNINTTAGQVARYGAFGGAASSGVTGSVINIPLPTDGLLLAPGNRLISLTGAIDVADQWTNIVAQVQEFPMGPSIEWLPSTSVQLAEMG